MGVDTTCKYVLNHHLHVCTAAQMWLLGRLLPLMIGDRVPSSDEFWSNYLDMLEIVDILMAPELSEDDVANLATLISDHHQQFKQLYPHASITPKMHYVVHMPRLIIESALFKFTPTCIFYSYFSTDLNH